MFSKEKSLWILKEATVRGSWTVIQLHLKGALDKLGWSCRVISIGERVLWDSIIYQLLVWVGLLVWISLLWAASKEGSMTFGEVAGSLRLRITPERGLTENEVYVHNTRYTWIFSDLLNDKSCWPHQQVQWKSCKLLGHREMSLFLDSSYKKCWMLSKKNASSSHCGK